MEYTSTYVYSYSDCTRTLHCTKYTHHFSRKVNVERIDVEEIAAYFN